MFDDFSEFDDRDAPSTMTRTFRYGTKNLNGRGNAVLDAGSFKPTGPERSRPRGEGPALGEQLPARERQALGDRAPAVRRRPADRLHVPRAHARGRHQLAGRAGARRDGAGLRREHPDRPRAGLRVDAHERRVRPGRHLRRDAVRRLAHQVPLQGPLPDDGARRRGHDRRVRAGRLPHDRARAGDRLREGQGPHRGRLPQARELRAGRAVAAGLPRPDGGQGALGGDVPRRVPRLPVHVQRRLRGRPGHRHVLGGQPAGPAAVRRSAPAGQGHRRVRVARRHLVRRAGRSRPTRRAACSSTGTTARRPAGARPTTTGATAPPSACGCSRRGSPSAACTTWPRSRAR